MYRFTFATIALILIMCFSAMATDTRVMTMGDNNNVLLDDANIWLYPGRTLEYPNLAIGEFDSDGFTKFGITWKFGDDNPWVLGTFFSAEEAYYPDNFMGGSLIPFNYSLMDNRRMDLVYGRSIGGNNFGLAFSLMNSSGEIGSEKESFTNMDVTLGLTEASGKWDLALGFGTGSWTDENAAGETETDKDGFNEFSLSGRYFMAHGPNYTFIPHVAIMAGKRGINYYNFDADVDLDYNEQFSFTGFEAGFGLNYTPSNAVLAVADVGIDYRKTKVEWDDQTTTGEYEMKVTALPYFKIGLDADVFKWMDIRLGATSYWVTEDDDVSNFKYASNDTYLGFGFHWGNLHIDTYTDPGMFLDGFNFLSGADNDMNFRFSAVYEM